MTNTPDIYDDPAWVPYETSEHEGIFVYARCDCGRYLQHGNIYTDVIHGIRAEGWICREHGEVEPLIECL